MTNQPSPTTVVGTRPYLLLNNHGQTVRLELTQNQHILGRDRTYADLVVPNDWHIISRAHGLLRKIGNDYQIYDGDGQKPSTNGLFLDRTRITSTDGLQLSHGMEIRIGQNPQDQILLTYFNPFGNQAVVPPSESAISLKNRSILIGRDPSANLHLESPIISRRHATIEPSGQGYLLQDYSTNGVFVNNQRVKDKAQLKDGDTIRLGPYTLVLRGDRLQILDRGNQIRIDAEKLVKQVKDKKGKTKRLLDEISLAIEPGQFVALVGGSGTGKSTLMRTLLGINSTNSGTVYLNGDDLRQNFNIYRNQIGYVPQDDIIHGQLTVTEVLTYAAKLRLPPDTNVKEVVQKTLDQIKMSDRPDVLVSKLSGGQRKRVSIGVELLADPKLFFLDEPTSGLDPGLDKNMMQLLRSLADQGRTIILVTHATANITLCDRIVFLGRGGQLCYFGPPKEAFQFFNITTDDFADIYNQLETDEAKVKQWANKFTQSPYYHRYVTNHLSQATQINPSNPTSPPPIKPGIPKQVKASPWQQLSILTQRYLKLILRDPVYLGLSLFTAPIGISLMNLAIREKTPLIGEPEPSLAPLALKVLFVFTCAALWVGLSASLQEIVKETAIYSRERLVNLGIGAYLGSKAIILGLLAVMQTLLIAAAILIGFKPPQPDLISWPVGLAITNFLSLFTCISLGLLISSLVKNSAQANSALPLLLLPQIIFSGVLFKIEGTAKTISWLMLSRWSVGAYGSLVNVNAMVPDPDKYIDFYGDPIPLPFDPSPVYEATWQNLSLNWGVLLLHTGIYLLLTGWVQKRKDIL
jgi:ABC-type multidrug transport system ATPase subunit/ABC-type multidrug transport system permease subunit